MTAALHTFPVDPLSTAAVLVFLVLAAAVLLTRSRRPWLARIRRKPLLTPNETEFFHRLQRAVPAYHVFPQVSFAALLTADAGLSSRARMAVRGRYDRKIADFVICESGTLKVVALVELDDRTHSPARDRYRDALTKAAGYQTFRFQSKQKPTEADIAALFQHRRA